MQNTLDMLCVWVLITGGEMALTIGRLVEQDWTGAVLHLPIFAFVFWRASIGYRRISNGLSHK